MQLLAVGEAMAELRRAGDGFATGFAGDTFNTAVYARRLLGPGSTGYLTRIGTDPLSSGFSRLALAEGLTTDRILRDPQANIGIYSVQTDAVGERSFHYWRSASAARGLFRDPSDLDLLAGAGLIYFSAITLAVIDDAARGRFLERLAALRENGQVRIGFDSNYRPRLWPNVDTAREWTKAAWRLTDIALPSVDDEMALFGDSSDRAVLDRLRSWGCSFGALKRGAMGPVAIGSGARDLRFAPAAQVVDSTSAGDSFNAGFLAAVLGGRDIETALIWGHETARTVVGAAGAIVPSPDAAALDAAATAAAPAV
jgi:2-dehydro-3-deoxygluconokinase